MGQLKKVKAISLIAFLFVFLFPFQAFAAVEDVIPTPSGSIYVQDPNHYLSEATKQQLIEQSRITYEKTSAQIGILVVDSLQDYSIEDFSVAALRKYGLGTEGKNNGVLVVMAIEDRQARIEVGYGLEGAIPDGKAGRMLDQYMMPALAENNYDQAVTKVHEAITRAILQEYGLESGTASDTSHKGTGISQLTFQQKAIYTGAGIVVLIAIGIIWKVFTRNMSRSEKSHLLMLIIQIIINMIGRGGGGNGGGRGNDRGGGGSSGGGGASRKW